MDADLKKRLQIILAVFVVLAAVRIGFIYRERHKDVTPPPDKTVSYSSNLDDYVTFPKVFPYDLKSAVKEVSGKTVWVRTGNQLPYFPFNKATRAVDFKRKQGLLPPLEKLRVTDVVLQRAPSEAPSPGQIAVVQKQVMAVFEKPDGPGLFAVSIGTNTGEDFAFSVNDVFFFADPHELYKHWPAEFWTAIDHHQAREGMSELQVSFALGGAGAAGPGDYGNREYEFSNAGQPVTVKFVKNKAVSVVAGPAK